MLLSRSMTYLSRPSGELARLAQALIVAVDVLHRNVLSMNTDFDLDLKRKQQVPQMTDKQMGKNV